MKKQGKFFFLLAFFLGLGGKARSEETFVLREPFQPGYSYHVSCRVDLAGKLQLPAQKGQGLPRVLEIAGKSAIEYDERILALEGDGKTQKTIRFYGRMDFERQVGDQVQQNSLRPQARRLVLLRLNQVEVPFSPTVPLTWNEIDLVRTDVFTPALATLLPDKSVRLGERWQASAAALLELTDLERVEEGSLGCQLESLVVLGKRRHARVAFNGSVRGLGEDGMARHQLDGFLLFDLDSRHLSYLSMKGTHFLLDKEGKEGGKIVGTFVLTRQPQQPSPEISEQALRGLNLEPNEENTLLLYDNPELGIRFLYPRRWRVAGNKGRQLGLDEARGSGLLMTVEALARLPSAQQYLEESRSWLRQQKVKIRGYEPRQPIAGAPQALEHFAFDAEVNGQAVRLEYYVVRQGQGGVTLAARLLPRDMPQVQRDVLRLARSLQITRPQ